MLNNERCKNRGKTIHTTVGIWENETRAGIVATKMEMLICLVDQYIQSVFIIIANRNFLSADEDTTFTNGRYCSY